MSREFRSGCCFESLGRARVGRARDCRSRWNRLRSASTDQQSDRCSRLDVAKDNGRLVSLGAVVCLYVVQLEASLPITAGQPGDIISWKLTVKRVRRQRQTASAGSSSHRHGRDDSVIPRAASTPLYTPVQRIESTDDQLCYINNDRPYIPPSNHPLVPQENQFASLDALPRVCRPRLPMPIQEAS